MRLALLLVVASSAVASAQPAYTAKVELLDKKREHHAVVTSKLTCTTPAKCPEWTLDLGRADSVELVGVADLLGEPTRLPTRVHSIHTDVPDPVIVTSQPESAKLPAAFVVTVETDAAETEWNRLSIVSLEGGRATLLGHIELAMVPKQKASYRSDDELALVATARGQPLAIEVVLRTRPWPPRRAPDRPMKRRFVMKDGAYRPE